MFIKCMMGIRVTESTWRPYALRSIWAVTKGSPPSWGSHSKIAPAQVPRTGLVMSSRIHLKIAGKSSEAESFPVSRMVVDSPPGNTSAWGRAFSRSVALRNSCISISIPESLAAAFSAAMWTWRAP